MITASALLRPGLLDGQVIALGGESSAAPELAGLGATIVEPTAGHPVDMLLHDLRPGFSAGGLHAALDDAWATIRDVANAAWIEPRRPGKAVLIAPAALDVHADAVRDAAENMARTLSIEWSRFGVRTVAIAPGAETTDDELAALAAYLASPAGDYFSGARLSLGASRPGPSPSPR